MPGNGYYKTIFSLSPPGTFYAPTPLTTGVHFTVDSDLDSPVKHPRWLDGWRVCYYLRNRVCTGNLTSAAQMYNDAFDPYLVLVLDVRCVTLSRGGPKVERVGWGLLPVFASTGHLLSGSYWVPLFEGTIPPVRSDNLLHRASS